MEKSITCFYMGIMVTLFIIRADECQNQWKLNLKQPSLGKMYESVTINSYIYINRYNIFPPAEKLTSWLCPSKATREFTKMPSRPSWLPSERQGEAVFQAGFLPTPSNPQAHSGISFRISSGLQLLISWFLIMRAGGLFRGPQHQHQSDWTNSCSWCTNFGPKICQLDDLHIAWPRVDTISIGIQQVISM